MLIRKKYPGELSGLQETPESVFKKRREIIKGLGLGLIGSSLFPSSGCGKEEGHSGSSVERIDSATSEAGLALAGADLYPAERNEAFKLDRPQTDEKIAASFNNFYEFTPQKQGVWRLVDKFQIVPWEIQVVGLVEKPLRLDIDELIRKIPLEERLYRFRCVETWAMAVPWTGFPLRELLKLVQPKNDATHVRFLSFDRPEQAPYRMREGTLPWPYTEGLTMAEANNEVAFLATGIYGHPLPKQHGAPIRLVVPWKYGFKSGKSITTIEVTNAQPATFWNTLIPEEYGFTANVNPEVPHPRWSQAEEWMIPSKERRPTLPFNGYGNWVKDLYA